MTSAIRGGLLAAASALALAIAFAPSVHAQQAALAANPELANPELAAKGVWRANATYVKDDIVTARGSTWIARRNNKGKVPGQTNPPTAADWQLFARGFNPLGAWVSSTTYQPDDLVTHQGQTFRAKRTIAAGGATPAAGVNWELLAQKGAVGATGPQGPAGPNTGIGNGSQSTPSISFSGDGDTGIYHPAENKIVLVEGGRLFLHNAGDFNSGFGLGALENNTGQLNTAVGHAALSNNETGNNNTALGAGALISNTTGSQNTAVGASALNLNESGANNTAVGRHALLNSDTSDNTAVGHEALQAQTTGASNTAVGATALTTNTTGNGNIAVGTAALHGNTSGNYNLAVGINALSANTTGAANVALGTFALMTNQTGNSNVAIGGDALRNNTANDNTALGTAALMSSTTGTGNTAVGNNTLASKTTGVNNVALGTNAGSGAINPANSIFIGNTGSAADTATIKIGNTQTTAFMAGISGADQASFDNPLAVYVDTSTGQLGVAMASSRLVKDDIEPMGDITATLDKLRPVSFRYKKARADGTQPLHYGLIAEEVAEVIPYLAAYNPDGSIRTVHYDRLPPFLLAGYQAQQKTIAAQADEIAELKQRLAAIEAALPRVTKAAAR